MPSFLTARRPRPHSFAPQRWILFALLLIGVAHATTYVHHSPDAMVSLADLIFVGTVDTVSVVNRDGTPWTEVTFAIDTLLKRQGAVESDAANGTLTLSFLGGDLAGGVRLSVAGMPSFEIGEQVLVFAYDGAYASPIVGFRQGLWRVTAGGVRAEDGSLLSLGSSGQLVAGGDGAGLNTILDTLRAVLPPLPSDDGDTP